MAVFDYKAKDLEGNTLTGVVEAPSEPVAQDVLKERELVVLSLKERKRMRLFRRISPFSRMDIETSLVPRPPGLQPPPASTSDYTTPWSIIASATLRKPAMLAPLT